MTSTDCAIPWERTVVPVASGFRLVRSLLKVIQAHHGAHRLLLRIDNLVCLKDDFTARVTHLVVNAIKPGVHLRPQ